MLRFCLLSSAGIRVLQERWRPIIEYIEWHFFLYWHRINKWIRKISTAKQWKKLYICVKRGKLETDTLKWCKKALWNFKKWDKCQLQQLNDNSVTQKCLKQLTLNVGMATGNMWCVIVKRKHIALSSTHHLNWIDMEFLSNLCISVTHPHFMNLLLFWFTPVFIPNLLLLRYYSYLHAKFA